MLDLTLTCPETGHPERIACVANSDGEILVVLRCSRFDPPAAVACNETCRQLAERAPACARRRIA